MSSSAPTVSLLSPRDATGRRVQVSLPVDPTAQFCGTVVEVANILPKDEHCMRGMNMRNMDRSEVGAGFCMNGCGN